MDADLLLYGSPVELESTVGITSLGLLNQVMIVRVKGENGESVAVTPVATARQELAGWS